MQQLSQRPANRCGRGRVGPPAHVRAGVSIAERNDCWVLTSVLNEDQDPGAALTADLFKTQAAGELEKPVAYGRVHIENDSIRRHRGGRILCTPP